MSTLHIINSRRGEATYSNRAGGYAAFCTVWLCRQKLGEGIYPWFSVPPPPSQTTLKFCIICHLYHCPAYMAWRQPARGTCAGICIDEGSDLWVWLSFDPLLSLVQRHWRYRQLPVVAESAQFYDGNTACTSIVGQSDTRLIFRRRTKVTLSGFPVSLAVGFRGRPKRKLRGILRTLSKNTWQPFKPQAKTSNLGTLRSSRRPRIRSYFLDPGSGCSSMSISSGSMSCSLGHTTVP